jgi:hypothetical protein
LRGSARTAKGSQRQWLRRRWHHSAARQAGALSSSPPTRRGTRQLTANARREEDAPSVGGVGRLGQRRDDTAGDMLRRLQRHARLELAQRKARSLAEGHDRSSGIGLYLTTSPRFSLLLFPFNLEKKKSTVITSIPSPSPFGKYRHRAPLEPTRAVLEAKWIECISDPSISSLISGIPRVEVVRPGMHRALPTIERS